MKRTISHKIGRIVLYIMFSWALIPFSLIWGIIIVAFEFYHYDLEKEELDKEFII